MSTRPRLSAHVCLTCQRSLAPWRLSRPHPARLQAASIKFKVRPYQEYTRLTKKEDAASTATVDRPIASGDGSLTLYGGRGKVFEEDVAELKDAISQGDTTKVLILRESILSLYNTKAGMLRDKEAEHIDIIKQLDKERGLPGFEEVRKNIDLFRPAEEERLKDWEDINALVLKLQGAFTSPQLMRYIEEFDGRKETPAPEAWHAPNTYEHIRRITPWRPGISDVESEFDNDPVRGYVFVSHTTKQRVVLRLLRECWGMELPELADGIGQFEIELHSDDLDLLLLGPHSSLDKLNSDLLNSNDEKLEVFKHRGVIRFTTKQDNKEMIVQAVKSVVAPITRKRIDLGAMVTAKKGQVGFYFDNKTLKEASKMAGTVISRLPYGGQARIVYMKKPNELSSDGDITRRLLWNSINVSERSKSHLASNYFKDAGTYIQYPFTDSLPWRERSRQWYRWAAPISKSAPEEPASEKPVSDEPISEKSASEAKEETVQEPSRSPSDTPTVNTTSLEKAPKRSQPRETKEGKPLWDRKFWNETSALMGNVLHTPRARSADISPGKPMDRSDLYHIFTTRVPNVSRLINEAEIRFNKRLELDWSRRKLQEQAQSYDFIVLRFKPDPWFRPIYFDPTLITPVNPKGHKVGDPIGAAAATAFPEIEMRLSINPRLGKYTLRTVDAIIRDSRTDVMLPEHSVDIRFQQQTKSRLQREFLSPVQLFIKKSKLAPDSVQLETPPSIILPISKHLCQGPDPFKLLGDERDSEKAKNEKAKKWKAEARDVNYLFTGLELHKKVLFDFKGWLISITSVEGGKGGGRRTELKLRPVKNQKVTPEEEFVQMACDLAETMSAKSSWELRTVDVRKIKADFAEKVKKAIRAVKQPYVSLFAYWAKVRAKVRRKADEGVLKEVAEDAGRSVGWEEMERVGEEVEGWGLGGGGERGGDLPVLAEQGDEDNTWWLGEDGGESEEGKGDELADYDAGNGKVVKKKTSVSMPFTISTKPKSVEENEFTPETEMKGKDEDWWGTSMDESTETNAETPTSSKDIIEHAEETNEDEEPKKEGETHS